MRKRLLAAVFFICLPAVAQAGQMTFGASSGACPAPSADRRCVNLTDSETTRILTWAKATYGQICTGEPQVCRDRTNAEALDAVSTGIFRGIRDNVLNYERELATKPAGDAVAPIGVP